MTTEQIDIKETHDLMDLVTRGSRARLRIRPKLLVGKNKKGDYEEGCMLDANAIVELIYKIIAGGTGGIPPENSVGSEQIIDGSIKAEDLSDGLKGVYNDINEELFFGDITK